MSSDDLIYEIQSLRDRIEALESELQTERENRREQCLELPELREGITILRDGLTETCEHVDQRLKRLEASVLDEG